MVHGHVKYEWPAPCLSFQENSLAQRFAPSRGTSDRGSALFRRVRNLSLWKLIRLSPVSNSVQYDIPAKDVIAQPVVSRPDAPLSLSRFQARQLFDIVPTRLVIRVLRKDIEKPVENA